MAASTRGSNCAASATTKTWPGFGDHRLAHQLGDLQRTAAARRPPPRHHAAGHVPGMKTPVPHPFRQPVPAVRGEQPGQFLVGRDTGSTAGWSRLLDHPRTGGLDVEPRPTERRPQLQRRIGIDRRAEGRIDLGGQRRPSWPAGSPLKVVAPMRRSGSGRGRRHAAEGRGGPSPTAASAAADSAAIKQLQRIVRRHPVQPDRRRPRGRPSTDRPSVRCRPWSRTAPDARRRRNATGSAGTGNWCSRAYTAAADDGAP